MRTQLLAFTCAALASLACAASASATTFNSAPTSTRTQTPCTVDAPCKLGFALSQAFTGDDVALAGGTYDFFAADPLEVRPGVTLHGERGSARPLIQQTAPYRDCDGCPILRLDSGATLRDVDVTQAVEGGGAVKAPADATIDRAALRGRKNALTFTDSNPNATPSGAREVLAVASDGTAIAALPGGPTVFLENVTAVGHGILGTGISVVSESGHDGTVDAVNTIARGDLYDVEAYAKPWGSPQGAGIDDVATLRMRYGNYRGGEHANESPSDIAWPNARIEGWDHNLPDDPKFVSDTDFHLADGSPAIDQGRTSGLLGTLDLDGLTRAYGDKPDVGAYEWQPLAHPADGGDKTPPVGHAHGGDVAPGGGDQQQPQPQGPQPGPRVDPVPQPAPGLGIPAQTVKVKKNVAAVKVECPATATNGCTGALSLVSGKVKVGSARFNVAAGKRGVV